MPVSKSPVLVTGASGFIGAEVTRQLLSKGYHVRGTTRSVGPATRYLSNLEGASERLEVVVADLLEPESFTRPASGCEYVIHVASPFVFDVPDPCRDLVEPAVQGSVGVLEASHRSGSVRRVVLTSSIGALTDEADGAPLTEATWNTSSSLTRSPYYFAKTQAEHSAWSFIESAHPNFDLVTILPAMTFGPSLVPGRSKSSDIIVNLTNGTWPGICSFPWWVVDVRDVALAHVLAMENPRASGRYIAGAAVMTMRDVIGHIRAAGWGDRYRLPSIPLDNHVGTFLVKLAVQFQPPGLRSWLRSHLGGRFNTDNSKIKRELGIEFRDPVQTILEAMEDLDRWGHLGKKA